MSELDEMLIFCENLVDKITAIIACMNSDEEDNCIPKIIITRQELTIMAEKLSLYINEERTNPETEERP